MSRFRLRSTGVEYFGFALHRPLVWRTRNRASCIWLGAIVGALAGWRYGTPHQPSVPVGELTAAPLGTSTAMEKGIGTRTTREEVPGLRRDGARLVPAVPQGLDTIPAVAAPTGSTFGEGSSETGCIEGMRLVEGKYCTAVARRCLEPYTDGSGRCGRYAGHARCYPPIVPLRFCIDEFEYPNRRGQKAQVMVTFAEAKRACGDEGKRLCTAREWTLACEGPERLPYPNGNVRDPAACNIDLVHRFPDLDALDNPATMKRELERLDQRIPSGRMDRCVSAYGVYDLTGNVDEWVVPDGPEEAAGFGSKTALKGGYFGPVRARCRPSTPSHGPTFKFYQVGFRCCSDAEPRSSEGSGR